MTDEVIAKRRYMNQLFSDIRESYEKKYGLTERQEKVLSHYTPDVAAFVLLYKMLLKDPDQTGYKELSDVINKAIAAKKGEKMSIQIRFNVESGDGEMTEVQLEMADCIAFMSEICWDTVA